MSVAKEISLLVKDVAGGPRIALKRHFLVTAVFVLACVAFVVVAFYRFKHGLGVTGLNDNTPWGVWTALKLAFVVSSGGAFVLTGMVYIFKMERFRPLVRSAALIGLLGYSSFALTLVFELGFPWRIVNPVYLHNGASILFEIAWCVMLYLTVLTLEFLPNLFERLKMQKSLKLFKTLTPSFVVAGIVLSVLHQSSLGSRFVVTPYKMNQLWYTPWVGAFFIISAIFCGMSMVILAELGMAAFDKREPRLDLAGDVGRFSIMFLALYLGFKIADIAERADARADLMAFDLKSLLFLLEIGLGVAVPIALFASEKIRGSARGLGFSAALVVLFGGGLNRLNVSVIALDHSPLGYRPNWVEYLFIPAMIVLVSGVYVILTRLFPIHASSR